VDLGGVASVVKRRPLAETIPFPGVPGTGALLSSRDKMTDVRLQVDAETSRSILERPEDVSLA
jgi:hypothetical protein